MAEYCGNCGAEMPEIAAFCPQCGCSRPPKMEEKKKKKVKWWMIVLPIVLILVVIAAFLWKPVYVHLMPEAALAQAAMNTMEDIKARNEGSPFHVFAKAYDETKMNTVEMEMDYQDDYTGEIRMNMMVQTDENTRQSQIEVTMAMYEQIFNVDAYVDPEGMALRMEQLTGEDYYGIVFETFSEDIRNNTLVFDAIGEENMVFLEEYVNLLQENLNTEVPELTLSESYQQIILDFVSQLEPVVDTGKLELSEKEQNCYTITYTVPLEDYAMLLEQFMDALENDDSLKQYLKTAYTASDPVSDFAEAWDEFIQSGRDGAEEIRDTCEGQFDISFWLYSDRIVNIGVLFEIEQEEGDDASGEVSLLLGENPAENDLILTFTDTIEKETMEFTLETVKDDESMAETLTITKESSDDDGFISLSYEWNREDGDLTLAFEMDTVDSGSRSFELEAELEEEENGFTFTLPELGELIGIDQTEEYGYSVEFDCALSITVTTGADIDEPDFINVGDLTQDMLYAILMNMYESYGT